MKTLPASFYFPASVCYGTSCRNVELPWVRDFDVLYRGVDVCVLATDLGRHCAGLYLRDPRGWRLLMSYQDMCNCLATASLVKIVINATTAETFPDGTIVFKNGMKQTDSTIHPSPTDVWVAVLAAANQIPQVDGDKNYIQSFINQVQVPVPHNLNKFPCVMVVDNAGNEVECDVINDSINALTLKFIGPFTGKVYVN